eukprot:2871678-Prymnesium_polylepis.1
MEHTAGNATTHLDHANTTRSCMQSIRSVKQRIDRIIHPVGVLVRVSQSLDVALCGRRWEARGGVRKRKTQEHEQRANADDIELGSFDQQQRQARATRREHEAETKPQRGPRWLGGVAGGGRGKETHTQDKHAVVAGDCVVSILIRHKEVSDVASGWVGERCQANECDHNHVCHRPDWKEHSG